MTAATAFLSALMVVLGVAMIAITLSRGGGPLAVGILIFSGIAIAVILPGQEVFLGNLYAFGALLSFTFAHASVARLRAIKPDFPRPYRVGKQAIAWDESEILAWLETRRIPRPSESEPAPAET